MVFGEYLKDKYGCNEPIYINEIEFNNYSRPWIFKELKKLVACGAIKRFDTGIYYFPVKMFFGDSYLDPLKIITRRFLSSGNDVYGYIAGMTLLNITGLSTQAPNLIELVTNNETTRVRNITIGVQRVRVRRSRAVITKENVAVLQFLDLMNSIKSVNMDETELFMLRKYVKDSGVTRNAIAQYTDFHPAKAMKNIIESGIIYDLA